MPFEIVRNDITKMDANAIVNSVNPSPIVGLGPDSSIHEAADPELHRLNGSKWKNFDFE